MVITFKESYLSRLYYTIRNTALKSC